MKKHSLVLQTVQYYWRHVRQYPGLVIPVLLLLPINNLLNNYIPPLILAAILNKLSKHEYQHNQVWQSFSGSLILFLVVTIIGGVLIWRVFDLFYWRLEGRVNRSIAQEVFNHLMRQSSDFHANEFAGSLVSATNKLIGSYTRMADTTFFQLMPLVVGLTFVSIVMAKRSVLYTLILVGFSVFYISISFFASRQMRQRNAEQAAAESRQTGILADAITNVLAIKSFAREDFENRRFAKATDDTYSKTLGIMRAFQRQQIMLTSVTSVLSWLALLAAIVSVVTFNANLATAFLIFNYTSSIVGQLFQFSNNSLRNYNRSFGDAREMITILAKEPAILDPDHPEPAHITRGAIEFHKVTFTHAGANEAIFRNFSLKVKNGEKIGLVGHSGSGKTTLTRLLLRFSDLDKGVIAIDGQNISKLKQGDLHDHIAYVPQEPLLFHRSIYDNIVYGQHDSSKKAVEAAAKQAHAHEFIQQLPHDYETLVGERGVKLSGGQRQRIAIARAMLKNAPILLLDEATSALDSESEVLIQDALWKLMEGRTAIVIAHRLSTIQRMDRIVVMDNGKIVEQGSHKELIRANGTYAKLWQHQSGGFIEE